MKDLYASFARLAASERLDVDFRVRWQDRHSQVVIIAPHGGRIEPGTSEIAAAIAGEDHSFYAFEGLRRGRPHRDLHITSTRFDEPHGLALILAARTAIAIHGRTDSGAPSIWVGGRDAPLRDDIIKALIKAEFAAEQGKGSLAGTDPLNVCNRTSSGAGVQLELPRSMRDCLAADEDLMRSFCSAVRGALG